MQDLSKLTYTGKGTPYNQLRGTLPAGYRILNKKQTKRYYPAQKKVGIREKAMPNCYRKDVNMNKVNVQLHRQERILNRCKDLEYRTIMTKAGYNYKK